MGKFPRDMGNGFFNHGIVGQLVVNIDEKKMEGAPGGHEGADGVLVEAVGLADEPFHPVALDGPFELALGYVDKELRRSRGVIVDAVDDAQRVYDEGTTLGKQAVDSCSAA